MFNVPKTALHLYYVLESRSVSSNNDRDYTSVITQWTKVAVTRQRFFLYNRYHGCEDSVGLHLLATGLLWIILFSTLFHAFISLYQASNVCRRSCSQIIEINTFMNPCNFVRYMLLGIRGFAKLKTFQKSKKNWIELTPLTHPHPNFVLGNPTLTWT